MYRTSCEQDRDRNRARPLGTWVAATMLLAVASAAGCDDAESVARSAAASPEMRANPGLTSAKVQADDFKVEATLEENIVALGDLSTHGGEAQLRPSGRRLLILMAEANHRTAVYMRQRANGWGISQIHGDGLANPIFRALNSLKNSRRADGDDFFLVEVKTMHLTLIGHREQGTLMLTTTEDRPDLGLTANKTQPATAVLSGLKDTAHEWAVESAKSFSARVR